MMKFEKICPLTGVLIKEYEFAKPHQIEEALQELHSSFMSWQCQSVESRQKILAALADRLDLKKVFFSNLITHEMGKPLLQSQGEVEKCIEAIRWLSKKDLSFLKPQVIQLAQSVNQVSHHPLGIIYSIMPWNFPLWQVIRMIIPALLAGNVILLKHSEVTPQIGEELDKLFFELTHQPLLRHLMIDHSLTNAVLADSRVQGVSLTGSTKAGLTVAQSASRFIKKTVFELGGSDPYIVTSSADLVEASRQIAQSRLQNTGQSCIAAKRCLVDRTVQDDFIDLLKKEFQSYRFGALDLPETRLGPLAHPRFKSALLQQKSDFLSATQASCLFSSEYTEAHPSSAYVKAEIYYLSKNSDWLKNQEFFAPLLIVIPFQTETEAVAIANSTDFALGASVWSRDLTKARGLASQVMAGQIVINGLVKSDVALPFGGCKQSGLGRELGDVGFFEFTQTHVLTESFSELYGALE